MIRTSLIVALLLAALPVQHAAAQTYKFKKVSYDKKNYTSLHDINAGGTVAGGYFANGATVRNCFLLKGKTKTTLSDPDASFGTECWGINTGGDVVGDYLDASSNYHGYIYTGGSFTTIDPPASVYTVIYGINDSKTVIGYYLDKSGVSHGFTYNGTKYKVINIKGGTTTEGFGINASGQYTVSTVLSDGLEHSYVFTGKKSMELVFPNIAQVAAHHINTAGQVCATVIDASSNYSGGVYDPVKKAYYVLTYPKAALTVMDGINDSETLVGRYSVTTSSESFGYIATGKLP